MFKNSVVQQLINEYVDNQMAKANERRGRGKGVLPPLHSPSRRAIESPKAKAARVKARKVARASRTFNRKNQ